MSESHENLPLNLWSHNHLWSGVDAWYPPHTDIVTVSSSDVSSSVGTTVLTQSCEKSITRPVNPPLPNWSPTSLLQDVDKSSIWSTSEPCSSDAKTLSLSDHTNQWSLMSPLPATLDGTWDAPRDPLLLDLPTVHPVQPSWKSNHVNASLDNYKSTSNCPTTVNNSNVHDFVSGEKPLASSEVEDNCDRSVLPGASDESPKLGTLSTEQLCDHLINTHEGWGRRPVNQSVPWDISSLAKLTSDQPDRSGIVTPTPSGVSGSTIVGSYRLPSTPSNNCLESGVWAGESPNGTAIWEKTQYDHVGVWPPGACGDSLSSHSLDSTGGNSSNMAAATPLMLVNSVGGPAVVGRSSTTTASQTSLHRPPFRDWENDKLCLPDGGVPSAGIGRPLLGGTRCLSSQMDDGLSHWSNSEASTPINGFDGAPSNLNSWMNPQTQQPPPSGVAAAMHWNANNTSIASNFNPSMSSIMNTPVADEVRRHHTALLNPSSIMHPTSDRMLVQPYSNTYRADLVKQITSQGFKKEDAQAALINCNMEPELALHELRERYKPSGAHSSSYGLMAQTTNVQQQNSLAGGNTVGQLSGTPVYQGTVANGNVSGAFHTTGRGKQQPNAGNSQLLNLMQHPQLMRQQFMQEFRSAFTLSLPNTLTNNSVVSTAGNSLLGQPPPPLLNGITPPLGSQPHQSNTSSSSYSGTSSIGSLLNRGTTGPPPPVTPLISNPLHNNSTAKRSPRQLVIINAMQELHKKHQSIQQQIHMYKNNPTMCAQPQYADVFAELQGQMQQIEAQLKAKQAQLNLVYSQDTATCFRGQQAPQPTAVTPLDPSFTNIGSGYNSVPGQRFTQDQLVQQLTELRLRGNTNASNNDQCDSDFPTIGMWTPHNKPGSDSHDKFSDHSSGPRSLMGSRGSSNNIRSQQQQLSSTGACWQSSSSSNWSNNPGSSNHSLQQQRHCTPQNWTQGGGSGAASQFNHHQMNGGGSMLSAGANNNHQTVGTFGGGNMNAGGTVSISQQKNNQGFSNTALDQPTGGGGGQWVLIQPLPGHPTPKLSVLHNLLVTQYGLMHFHVINQSNACVLVRLQSTDSAFQLMRSLNTRLSIELLQESEVISHMQRANSRGDFASNGVSSPSDLNFSCSSATAPNWSSTTDPANNAASFFPRKSSAQNNPRFGTIASSIF